MSRKINKKELCPVCGYNFFKKFHECPWSGDSASDEFCPSCGIQFGYDDAAGGDLELRKNIYMEWRDKWINNTMQWDSPGVKKPNNWKPKEQLRQLEEIEKLENM